MLVFQLKQEKIHHAYSEERVVSTIRGKERILEIQGCELQDPRTRKFQEDTSLEL